MRNVDLRVEEGELAVLMGSSGSGKSTLLYLLSGLESVDYGRDPLRRRPGRYDERDRPLHASSHGHRLRVPGDQTWSPHLSLLENVVLPGYLVESDRDKVDQRGMELLDSMGIGHLADRLPAQVSGGEQQRAAIARALINAPRAVLADEPTGALNSAAGQAVLDAFREINRKGQTVLMATHEVKAACIGDRILYMRDGEVQAEYRPGDSGTSDGDREAAVLGWLVSQGW